MGNRGIGSFLFRLIVGALGVAAAMHFFDINIQLKKKGEQSAPVQTAPAVKPPVRDPVAHVKPAVRSGDRMIPPKPQRKNSNHAPDLKSMTFSPDGRYLVFAVDQDLFAIDTSVGEVQPIAAVRKFNQWADSGRNAGPMLYSPDGGTLAVAVNQHILLLDGETFRVRKTLVGFGVFKSLAFCSDGRYLLTADVSVAAVWDVASGRRVRALSGYEPESGHRDFTVEMALFGRTDQEVITFNGGSSHRRSMLWDVVHAQMTRSVERVNFSSLTRLLPGRESYLNVVNYGKHDLRFGLQGNPTAVLEVRDVFSGSEEQSVHQNEPMQVLALAMSPEKDSFITGTDRGQMHVWGLPELRMKARVDAHMDLSLPVSAVAYSPDGSMVASGGNGLIRLWKTEGFELLATAVFFGEKEWFVYAPDNRFAGTKHAVSAARLERNDGRIRESLSQSPDLETPGLWQEVFAGYTTVRPVPGQSGLTLAATAAAGSSPEQKMAWLKEMYPGAFSGWRLKQTNRGWMVFGNNGFGTPFDSWYRTETAELNCNFKEGRSLFGR